MCLNGHLAPELLLFGPARASTTTFAEEFALSPDVVYGKCGPKDYTCVKQGNKEMHFFDTWKGEEDKKHRYLEHFPECTNKRRQVAADLTPGLHVAGSQRLQHAAIFYGDKKKYVSFVMVLRKPIDCLQSFFYYESEHAKISFAEYAEQIVTNKMIARRHLNNVLYAPALKEFFATFNASQLTIVPMAYNTAAKSGFPPFVESVWHRLGLTHPPQHLRHISNFNQGAARPHLDAEVGAEALAALERRLDELTGPTYIAEIIASAPGRGPHLYGYQGAFRDSPAVADWLAEGW